MKPDEIYYSDHLEKEIGELLTLFNIKFIHESQDKDQGLDFYIPGSDVYIEVKQFHADRICRQLQSYDNVIVLQGKKSVKFLVQFIKQLL